MECKGKQSWSSVDHDTSVGAKVIGKKGMLWDKVMSNSAKNKRIALAVIEYAFLRVQNNSWPLANFWPISDQIC